MSTRITFVDDELAHYGVKGMKWGTRKDRKAGRKAAKQHIKMVNPYRITSVHKRLEYDKAAKKAIDAHKGNDAFLEGYRDVAAKRILIYNGGVRLPKRDPATRKAAQEQLEQIVRHYRKDFQARVRDLERINSGG